MSDKSPFQARKVARIEDMPEEASKASNNFKERLVGMTFNMPFDWHREFKMRALQENISMRELLIRSFDAYKQK